MKNLIKAFALSSISLLAYQTTNAQANFGVKGGLNISEFNQSEKPAQNLSGSEAKIGFHVGAFVDIPVVGNFLSIQPEVQFSTKGDKVTFKDDFTNTKFESKSTTYYLDVPVNLKASLGIGNLIRVYGAAGPYFGFGVAGEYKTLTQVFGGEEIETKKKIDWGSEVEDQFKRFDTGVSVGAGVEIKSLVIGAAYDLGLYNISTEEGTSASKINNRVLKVSVGVKF